MRWKHFSRGVFIGWQGRKRFSQQQWVDDGNQNEIPLLMIRRIHRQVANQMDFTEFSTRENSRVISSPTHVYTESLKDGFTSVFSNKESELG
jgi:hypothetical protein